MTRVDIRAIKRDEAIGLFCEIATALEVDGVNLTERTRLALHQFANDCAELAVIPSANKEKFNG